MGIAALKPSYTNAWAMFLSITGGGRETGYDALHVPVSAAIFLAKKRGRRSFHECVGRPRYGAKRPAGMVQNTQVAVTEPAETFAHLPKCGQKQLPVAVVFEDRLSLIAPRSDVIKRSIVFNP